MRQLTILILLISLLGLGTFLPTHSAVRGGIQYTIPTDYSKINESEINTKAKEYFYNAERLKDGNVNEDMTNALTLYNILQQINPDIIEYPIKLGILYDKIGKDRQAKGNLSRAIGLDNTNPLPYYHFGNLYYKRELYRKALKYYCEAYKRGFEENYDLLYKMGDIFEKFGDTRSALKYLNYAQEKNPNPELENKIKQIEAQDKINKEYYTNTRIKG